MTADMNSDRARDVEGDVSRVGASPLRRSAVVLSVFGLLSGAVFLGILRCPMALLVRRPCPGCGLTRATIAALHGDFAGSFHHHPLAVLMVPFVAWLLLRNVVGYVARGVWGEAERKTGRVMNAFFVVIAFAMFAVWIARFFGAFGGPEPV